MFTRQLPAHPPPLTRCSSVHRLPCGACPPPWQAVTVDAFPIGIDPARFRAALQAPKAQARVAELQEQFKGMQIILGIDRVDYIKGIPQKLLAMEQLLERHPEMIGKVVLLQARQSTCRPAQPPNTHHLSTTIATTVASTTTTHPPPCHHLPTTTNAPPPTRHPLATRSRCRRAPTWLSTRSFARRCTSWWDGSTAVSARWATCRSTTWTSRSRLTKWWLSTT